jgi:hypothetical protein
MLSGEVQTPIFFAYVCVISKFIYIKKMKTNFFKAVLFGLAVLFAGSIQAQNSEIVNVSDSARVDVQEQVSNQIKKGMTHFDFAGTAKEAYQFLKTAPADTIVTAPVAVYSDTTVTRVGHVFELSAQDTLYVSLRYSLDGPRSLRRDTLCILNEHVTEFVPVMSETEKKVRRLALETAVLDTVQSGRERDRNGYRIKFDNGNEYEITSMAKDKYGPFAGGYTGGQIASGMGGFRGGIEGGYSWRWGMALAQVGVAHNRYTDNATAENANRKMWAFEARAGVGPTLYFGRWKQWSITPLAGISETSYRTDSREVTNPDGSIVLLQSGGNAWSWWAGIRGTYRGFNNIGMAGIQFDFTKVPNVIQNQGQIGRNAFTITAFFDFDFFRCIVNNRK